MLFRSLFMFALSILLSTSLRGWFITGHDIRHEFQVFTSTNTRAFWLARVPSYDPYNSCLSISILPTVLYNITHIPAEYIYKAVFQVVFAFGIVPMFYVFKKFLADKSALLAGFVFITFPVFINDLTFLNRQEIAFLFFIALMIVSFSQIAKRPKYILTIMLLLGILLSHYSTNYVTVGLLITSFAVYKVISYKQMIKKGMTIPLLSVPIIIVALLATYAWGSLLTQTSPNLGRTITRTLNSIKRGNYIHSTTTKFSILGSNQQSPQEALSEHAGDQKKYITYVPIDELPLTSLGNAINRIFNVQAINNFIHSSVAKFYQLFIIFGTAGLSIMYFRRRGKKKYSIELLYLTALSDAAVILLVMITTLPYVSVSYDIGRLFAQMLVITVIPTLYICELHFKSKTRITYIFATLFVLIFLHNSGLIPQLTGGFDPKINLANSGTYYNFFYEHGTDVAQAKWMMQNQNVTKKVFIDTTSSTTIPFYVSAELLGKNTSNGYLYQTYRNVTANTYRTFYNGQMLEYRDTRLTINRNLLYSNQNSAIYGSY